MKTPKIKSTKQPEKPKILAKQSSLKFPKIPLKKSTNSLPLKRKSLKIPLKNENFSINLTHSMSSIPEILPKISKELEEKLKHSINSLNGSSIFELSSTQLHDPINLEFFFGVLEKKQKNQELNLQLQKNFLDDHDLSKIMKRLENFTKLKSFEINLEQNNIGGPGLVFFAKKLTLLQLLQKISLNLTWAGMGNLIWGGIRDGIVKLGTSFNSLPFLIDLELVFDWNMVTFDSMMDFFLKMKEGSFLKFLKISMVHTGLNDDLCQGLSQFLKAQSNLLFLKLNVKWNEISDEGLLSLLPGIFENSSKLRRVELNFDNNRITDVGLLSLSHWMKNLKKLQQFELKMYDNMIDLSYQMFIEEILKMPYLFSTIFHLGKCIFNEKQIIITKIQYVDVLNKFKKKLNYKEKRINQMLNIINAIKGSIVKKKFRREIVQEIIELF